VSKSPNPDSMIWVVETLWDMTKVKNFPEPPSLRAFSGQMPGSGGKGLVELQSFKMEMRKYLTADALIPHSWATDVKTTINDEYYAEPTPMATKLEDQTLDADTFPWVMSATFSVTNPSQICHKPVTTFRHPSGSHKYMLFVQGWGQHCV
jgi:hypothetical protein